ncbi:SDR family oxidoreductase [Candidatus Thorarchaeota archaeon]|nr:MAG: SDR family oxidoreductase [Candidatus Thorarchaeota archaeon]
MDLKLEGRIFLVTAASRGLGYGVAKALVEEGASVIICSRHKASLESATRSLGSLSQFFVCDLSQEESVRALLEDVAAITDHLDGIFVNAGGPPPGSFSDLTEKQWLAAFNLTLMSAVRLTREALPLLQKADSPCILYSTSISVKQPIEDLMLSNSLRSAVIGMMRTLADEIGPEGIRVNAICPGWILTDRVDELLSDASSKDDIISRIPLRRMGTPDEFGEVSAFLMSPVSSYVHGALLLMDGGLYRGMM